MRTSRSEPPPDVLERLYLRIRPEQIGFFRFILEGYDGLAILSTMDAATGRVRLLFPASRGAELRDLLNALARESGLETAPVGGHDTDEKDEVSS